MSQFDDDQLHEAGRRWRASAAGRAAAMTVNTAPSATRTQPPMRRWGPAIAAVVVLVLVVGSVVLLQRAHASRATPSRPKDPYAIPTDLKSMPVHDGDRVRAIGQLMESNVGPLLCTHVGAAAAVTTSTDAPKYGCGSFTIARLTGDVPSAEGAYELTGTYRNGTIAVDQIAPSTSDYAAAGHTDSQMTTPCQAPAGGWNSPSGTADYPDLSAVQRYVDEHHDLVGGLWYSTPDPNHKVPDAEGGTTPLQILAIGVAGSPAQVDRVRNEVSARYDGELCVYHVPYSMQQQDAAGTQASVDVGSAIIQPGNDPRVGREYVEVKLLNSAQASKLAALGDVIQVYPHVWPVG